MSRMEPVGWIAISEDGGQAFVPTKYGADEYACAMEDTGHGSTVVRPLYSGDQIREAVEAVGSEVPDPPGEPGIMEAGYWNSGYLTALDAVLARLELEEKP